MKENAGLEVEIGITLRKLTQELAKAESRMVKTANKWERDVKKSNANAARSFSKIDAAIAKTGNNLNGLKRILIGALSTREVQRYADAWTVAGNKIASAGVIAGRSGRSLSGINDIATKTRSGLVETADLYAKLLRATKDVAKGEEEVALATELTNKAFKAGGAAASEQAAGILQLAQGLSSGILQGDELRSIRENAPVIAQAIADEFGVTIGKLKELGSQGQLTSDKVFRAIINAQPKIEAAFAATNSTIGEGFTLLRNSLTEYIGVADDSIGATEKIGVALKALSENLDLVVVGLGLLTVRGLTPAAIALVVRLAPAAAVASTALQLLTVSGGAATVAMSVLRGALALLGGPIGLGLIALSGAAYAFSQIKDSAEDFEAVASSLKGTLSELDTTNGTLLGDYKLLKTAVDDLAAAQALGGKAAIDAAVLDVAAIQSRITANAALRQERAIIAQIELADLKASLAAQDAAQAESAKEWLAVAVLKKEFRRAAHLEDTELTAKEISAFIAGEKGKARAAVATGAVLTDAQRSILNMSIAYHESTAEVEAQEKAVKALVGEAEKLEGPLNAAGLSVGDIVAALGQVDFSNINAGAELLGDLLARAAAAAAALANVNLPTGGDIKNRDEFGFANQLAYEEYGRTRSAAPKTPPKVKKVRGSRSGGGDGGVKEVPLLDGIDKQITQLERQIEMIGKTNREIATMTAKYAALDEAKKRGLDLDARQAASGRTLREEIDAQAESVGALTEEYEKGKLSQDKFEGAVDGIAGAMAGALIKGESFRESMADIFKGIAYDILKSGIKKSIMSVFDGGGGGGFWSGLAGVIGGAKGGVASANGNVFSGGAHVQAYANGGVVNSPTNFPISGGKMGLMGEAGPEAIMPLTRIGGKLGVLSTGGDINVNVTVAASEDLRVTAEVAGENAGRSAAVNVVQANNHGLFQGQRRQND